MTGRRLNPLRDSRPESLPELGGVDYSASHGVPRRKRIVAGRHVYSEQVPRAASAAGNAAGGWLHGEQEDAWVRRAVKNQAAELKRAFLTADRLQRHRRNPRSVVHVMQTHPDGVLPAADVRNLLASRGIPLTDGYWAELCASCAAPGTNAGVSEAPLKYARVLNRYVREADAQAALAKVSATHTSVKQAQELIRRSILMKIKGGPAELRRAFQHIDTDGSGHIDRKEFTYALRMKANLSLSEELLEQVLASYDDDGSGVIDYRKFCQQVMGSHEDDDNSGVSRKPEGAKADAKAMFNRKMRLGYRDMKFQLGKRHPSGRLSVAQLNRQLQRHDVTISTAKLAKMCQTAKAMVEGQPDQVEWNTFLNAVLKGQHTASHSSAVVSSKWMSVDAAKELIRTKINGLVKSGPSGTPHNLAHILGETFLPACRSRRRQPADSGVRCCAQRSGVPSR